MSNLSLQPHLVFSPQNADARQELEQFLRFYLQPDTKAMLPVGQIAEVLKIDLGRIAPMPHLPAWVMGVYNWRGNILWMVDLGQLLGLDPWQRQNVATPKYTAIVLRCDRRFDSTAASLGLVVTRVEDLEWCRRDRIQALPAVAVTSALAPFLKGYWLHADSQTVLVLEGKAIAAAMPQTSSV